MTCDFYLTSEQIEAVQPGDLVCVTYGASQRYFIRHADGTGDMVGYRGGPDGRAARQGPGLHVSVDARARPAGALPCRGVMLGHLPAWRRAGVKREVELFSRLGLARKVPLDVGDVDS